LSFQPAAFNFLKTFPVLAFIDDGASRARLIVVIGCVILAKTSVAPGADNSVKPGDFS
jgi:hypothetical protein